MVSPPLTEAERLTAVVYGDTFALYDEASFDEFVAPLRARLQANQIPLDAFKDKRCLDAGCGGGRASVLMAQAGAREVVGVDLSPTNVASCQKRALQKGLSNARFVQHSLLDLPFEDASFDVVWCNGVLHHTADPDRGLREITRVLKPAGALWLYLYGSGGIYWHMVDWVRAVLAGTDVRDCIFQLRLEGFPIRRIAEWIDDWYVPYLRRYTPEDVTRRLRELGFPEADVLRFGVNYDTSQRRVQASPAETALMGAGDLRYFCRKTAAPTGGDSKLPDPPGGKGSHFVDGPEVTQFDAALAEIAGLLAQLETRMGSQAGAWRVMACRAVHHQVRSLLESGQPFDCAEFARHLADLISLLRAFAG